MLIKVVSDRNCRRPTAHAEKMGKKNGCENKQLLITGAKLSSSFVSIIGKHRVIIVCDPEARGNFPCQ